MGWLKPAIVVGAMSLAACQTTGEYAGSGPITLAPHIEEHFQKYLAEDTGYAFAVAVDGRSGSGFIYCRATNCGLESDRRWSAIQTCEESSGGVPCKIYAVRKEVVWNKSGPRLWDPADPSVSATIPILTPSELQKYPHESEQEWLSNVQHTEFADYLRALEEGSYPVGAFAIADDGQYYWSTHTLAGAGPTATAERSIEKCRERSELPDTCRLFATNNLILSKDQRVTSQDYWSHVPRGKPSTTENADSPTLAAPDISPELLESEQNWLTVVQLRFFGSYLRTLENGARPFGVFVVADDGRAVSRPWAAVPNALKLAAEDAIGICRKASKLPETCHIFAANNRISSTGKSVTTADYRDHVEVRTGLLKHVAERDRVLTVQWEALGPEFKVRVQPAFSEGNWSMPFTLPDETAKCRYQVTYNLDHVGQWSLSCDNGRTASGKGRFFIRNHSSASNGIGDDGKPATILSALPPEETS